MLPAHSIHAAVPASGPFDLVTGLPVHSLIVHFAVVILPLAALALIAIVFVPKWRKPFGWVVMAGLLVGTGAAFVAKESGEQLADRIGLPKDHASLGDILPLIAVLTFIVAAVWFWMTRRPQKSEALTKTLGVVAAVLALVTAGMTTAVGHTGAQAVWEGRIAATEGTPAPAPAATDAASTGAGSSASGALTMAEVAKHASGSDCWSAVNGTVYDLTQWINQHPGGPQVIEALCGKDGTAAFDGQHQGQGEPAAVLKDLAVGSLGQAAAAASPSAAAAGAATGITAAEVLKHSSASDCWSVVNGTVYDLTQWIGQHPGGAQVIEALCGKDGTAAFDGQHQGQKRPEKVLQGFEVGTFSAAAEAPVQNIDTTLMAYRTAKKITLAEVKTHNTAASCWSAINGKVYDLTKWIGRHPGGSGAIKALCGKNGSAMFNGQHGGGKREASILATYKIGKLA